MTVETDTKPPLHHPCLVAPLVVWLLIQLLALMLGAFRVPLWARVPQPAERFALHEMLMVQIVFAGMLFPWLMRSWRAAIAVVVTSLPFIHFASFLAGAELRQTLAGAGFLTAWLAALAMLAAALRDSERAQLRAIAIVNFLTLGGAALGYLQAETGQSFNIFVASSPLLAGVRVLDSPTSAAWIAAATYVGFGAIFAAMHSLHRARQRIN